MAASETASEHVCMAYRRLRECIVTFEAGEYLIP